MAKYRKKPITIEAEQWFPSEDEQHKIIKTSEGNMFVHPGDWIVTGVNGEKYSCKPDIFEKTYELVENYGKKKDE